MGIKMPEFRNCCFCMPLRTGLLTLGYINLFYHGVICIPIILVSFFITFMSLGMGGVFPPLDWWLFLPLVMVSEVIFNILVIVGSHKKDARLLKLTFIFGAALWIFTVLYSVCITDRLWTDLRSTDYSSDDQFKLGVYMTVAILEPIILGYVLLLVWSLKRMIRARIQVLPYIDLDTNREVMTDYERLLPIVQ